MLTKGQRTAACKAGSGQKPGRPDAPRAKVCQDILDKANQGLLKVQNGQIAFLCYPLHTVLKAVNAPMYIHILCTDRQTHLNWAK